MPNAVRRTGKEVAGSFENMDPRLLKRFLRQPSFIQRTSPGTVAKMRKYLVTSRWPRPQREVYDAVLGGCTSEESIATETGLTPTQVRRAVTKLQKMGYVKTTLEPKEPLTL